MNIHSRIKPSSPLYVCDKDSIQLLVSEATPHLSGATPRQGHSFQWGDPPPLVGSLPLIGHVGGGMPHNAMHHNDTPYNAMPLNATPNYAISFNDTPHVFFCTLLDFSKLKLFFFHYC